MYDRSNPMFQQSESRSSASLLPAVVLERRCVQESPPAGNGLHQLPNAVAHLARFRASARKRGGGEYVVNPNFLKSQSRIENKANWFSLSTVPKFPCVGVSRRQRCPRPDPRRGELRPSVWGNPAYTGACL